MSNKNNTKPVSKEAVSYEERARLDATKIFLIVFACVALVGIIAAIIVGVVSGLKNKSIDYMKVNLSKYVYVSEDLYNSYDVKINIPDVTDRDVEEALLKVLCQNKITPDGPMINRPNVTLSAGDVANIYYRGYTLDEDGSKNYFDGGCNFGSSITALELGSGSFIPGFESNLIGKNQKDYATMEKVTDGIVEPGDIIKFTYSSYYADGTARMAQTATIDLGDPKTDEIWGKGFTEYFSKNLTTINEKFGTNSDSAKKIKVETTRESKDGATTDVYFDMTISEVYRVSEGEKLVVEAYFPVDYKEKTLQGKTAYFEVYIKTAQDYTTPELDEKFITETLKLTKDELSSFEGETIVDQYKGYLRAELVDAYNEKVESAIDTAFWDIIIKGANFKKLPEDDVEKEYNESLAEIQSQYANGYSSYYSSVDAFAIDYLGLESKADWKAEVRKNAEDAIKQKLAFYYIVREEKLIPSDEEYDKLYNEIFDDHLKTYLDYYKITEDSEDYETKLEAAKTAIKSQFADSYWFELVIYDYAMDILIDNANVTKE